MPIVRLLQNHAFGPEDIKVISAAYEQTLSSLGLIDRTDPLTTIVAEKIIECARMGERDPARLRDCALKLLQS
jgi:hypothetical protein